MKKSKEFLKKLAAITLCSIAALQNISANTVINFDQDTVSFDSENPQKATVVSGGATREVPGIQDGDCYLYPLDENNFICCNPNLNTYDVLSAAPSTSTQIYDFGNGITFWCNTNTSYCYFTDNGRIIPPTVLLGTSGVNSCQFQYHKSNGVSYTICYENGVFYYPKIINPYDPQVNINYPPAPENNNNLNNFNYNQTQVVNSNAPQSLFRQTQTDVSPIPKITSNPGNPSNESLRKPPTKRWRPRKKDVEPNDMPAWTENYNMPNIFLENKRTVWLLKCQTCDMRNCSAHCCGCGRGSGFTPHTIQKDKSETGKQYSFKCKHCERHGQQTYKKFENKDEVIDAITKGKAIFYYCRGCTQIKQPERLSITSRKNTERINVMCKDCVLTRTIKLAQKRAATLN